MVLVLLAMLVTALPASAQVQEQGKVPATTPPPNQAPSTQTPSAANCADQIREINKWIESNPVPDAQAQRRAIILRMRDRASSSCAAGSQEFAMRKIHEVRQMLGMPPPPTEVGTAPVDPKPGRPGASPD